MPSRDKSGKELSGAEKARLKKQKIEDARRNEATRRQEGAPLRHELGPPPIGNPIAGVAYAHDALLVTLDEVLRDTQITAEQRWNLVTNISKALGLTHAKAHVQRKLQELELEDEEEQDDANGLQEIETSERGPTRRRRPSGRVSEIRRSSSPVENEDGGDPP